jgi:predicted CopG family antitoxin
MSGRKTITVTEACYERLQAVKRSDESWTDCLTRLADDTDTERKPNTAVVENIEEIARRTASEVEDRMTRR